MPRFKWIEWNLQKIDAHGLTPSEVEAAFSRIIRRKRRRDGSVVMDAETPSGRRIRVVWRFDREVETSNRNGEPDDPLVFVITAY